LDIEEPVNLLQPPKVNSFYTVVLTFLH